MHTYCVRGLGLWLGSQHIRVQLPLDTRSSWWEMELGGGGAHIGLGPWGEVREGFLEELHLSS